MMGHLLTLIFVIMLLIGFSLLVYCIRKVKDDSHTKIPIQGISSNRRRGEEKQEVIFNQSNRPAHL